MSSSMTRQIPDVLCSRPQWVGWRTEMRNAKPTKVPINPLTGQRAATNQPDTWGSFEDAQAAVTRYQLAGIGFVFSEHDPFVGIDLDKCRDAETDIIEPWAQAIINELDSYTEISPSGKGIHILLSGSLPAGSRHKGCIEMYDRGRYFTMTGDHLPGTPSDILPRELELWAVHAKAFGAIETSSSPGVAANGKTVVLTNEALIQRASAARNGSKFSCLLAGNWTGAFPSQSEADAALCALLAFWTGKDAAQMDSLFRQSGLFRSKWDDVHFSDGRTYGQETLARAIRQTSETYNGTWKNGHGDGDAAASNGCQPGELPTINVGITDLAILTSQSWQAIEQANHPPLLFNYGRLPSRLEFNGQGAPVLKELNVDRFRYEVARAATWILRTKNKEVSARPPLDVIRDMLASPAIPLPPLQRIIETPVFGKRGQLLNAPGYHETDQLYYAATSEVNIPAVPTEPTHEQIQDATRLLLEEFLGDFPFANESSRAHALGCLLLPFVRDLIDGPTPLHLFEKPTSRTGGTLLAKMLVLPSVGASITHLTETKDDEEWRKLITATLMQSPLAICFDNLRRRLESAALASVLTTTLWGGRVLGHSEIIKVPNRALWLATGNNPTLSDELLGRTVFIRLDARIDRPQDRTGFRHALPAWAFEHRADLIHAALVLCQSWIVAGQPKETLMKGGFEDWSAVIGGILRHVGISGFLTERESVFADPDTQAWREFVRTWWARHKDAPVGVAALFDIANPNLDEPIDLDLGDGTPRSQKIRLGHKLIEKRDRQFAVDPTYRLQLVSSGSQQRAKQWILRLIPNETAQGGSGEC